MRLTPQRRSALVWPVLSLLVVAEAARPAEVSLRMSLRLGEAYNDNVRLVATQRSKVFITTLSPGAELSAKTETFSATGRARISVNRYHGDSALNNVDVIVDTLLAQQFERNRAELAIGYVRDSTLSSELTQTGIVQANRERVRASVGPSWTAQLSERTSWKLGYEYADVQYQDRAGTDLTNYRTDTAATTLSYRWSERSNALIKGGVSRLNRDAPGDALRTTFISVGLQRDLSELLKAQFDLGGRRVRLPSANGSRIDNGWLAEARLQRRRETGSIAMTAARALNPTGSGELTQTDQLSVSWSENLSPRLTLGVNGSLYWNERISTSASARDRYYRAGASLTWLASERWAIETELSHARQQPDEGSPAKANAISINARYDWPL